MALQQPGTGYRDPSKAMTIKALQERQKAAAAAAAAATAVPEGPMSSPFQGLAHMTGILSGQVQQNRADAQEADARQRLTEMIAGIDPTTGPTQQQYAEMRSLDPDMADRQYEAAMKERWADENRRDEQGFTRSEREAAQGFTAGQQRELFGQQDKTAATKVTTDENAAVSADERADQNTIDKAKLDADEKMRQEAAAVEEQKRQEAAETDVGPEVANREAEWLRLNPGGDKNSPEAQAYILRNAAPSTGGLNSPSALKDINEFKLQGTQLDSALNTISRAEELLNGGNVVGGDAALWLFDKAGSLPGGTWAIKQAAQMAGINLSDQQIADTMEFDSIMGLSATEHMANTLKGQSSNMEMQAFRRDMANRNAPDTVKRNAVQRMKSALMSDRGALDSTLQQFQQPAMLPYEYKSSATTAPAPADAGTGGTDEPQEGDIFTSPGKPDLVYRGGKYVPVGAP
jgi:hypothetical protein